LTLGWETVSSTPGSYRTDRCAVPTSVFIFFAGAGDRLKSRTEEVDHKCSDEFNGVFIFVDSNTKRWAHNQTVRNRWFPISEDDNTCVSRFICQSALQFRTCIDYNPSTRRTSNSMPTWKHCLVCRFLFHLNELKKRRENNACFK